MTTANLKSAEGTFRVKNVRNQKFGTATPVEGGKTYSVKFEDGSTQTVSPATMTRWFEIVDEAGNTITGDTTPPTVTPDPTPEVKAETKTDTAPEVKPEVVQEEESTKKILSFDEYMAEKHPNKETVLGVLIKSGAESGKSEETVRKEYDKEVRDNYRLYLKSQNALDTKAEADAEKARKAAEAEVKKAQRQAEKAAKKADREAKKAERIANKPAKVEKTEEEKAAEKAQREAEKAVKKAEREAARLLAKSTRDKVIESGESVVEIDNDTLTKTAKVEKIEGDIIKKTETFVAKDGSWTFERMTKNGNFRAATFIVKGEPVVLKVPSMKNVMIYLKDNHKIEVDLKPKAEKAAPVVTPPVVETTPVQVETPTPEVKAETAAPKGRTGRKKGQTA